jgi:hypothetical protein
MLPNALSLLDEATTLVDRRYCRQEEQKRWKVS